MKSMLVNAVLVLFLIAEFSAAGECGMEWKPFLGEYYEIPSKNTKSLVSRNKKISKQLILKQRIFKELLIISKYILQLL